MYRLHGYRLSANSYKVDLLFHQLGIVLERVECDIEAGASHTPAFRDMNAFELTPVVEVTESRQVFVESNAILWHFSKGTNLAPVDAVSEYETLKWMFFEQNVLEPNIGRARRLLQTPELMKSPVGSQLEDRQRGAATALRLLDQAIGGRRFLARDTYGIADIAVFAYTHVAPEGGVSLEPFANVRRWLAEVQSTPRFKAFSNSL